MESSHSSPMVHERDSPATSLKEATNTQFPASSHVEKLAQDLPLEPNISRSTDSFEGFQRISTEASAGSDYVFSSEDSARPQDLAASADSAGSGGSLGINHMIKLHSDPVPIRKPTPDFKNVRDFAKTPLNRSQLTASDFAVIQSHDTSPLVDSASLSSLSLPPPVPIMESAEVIVESDDEEGLEDAPVLASAVTPPVKDEVTQDRPAPPSTLDKIKEELDLVRNKVTGVALEVIDQVKKLAGPPHPVSVEVRQELCPATASDKTLQDELKEGVTGVGKEITAGAQTIVKDVKDVKYRIEEAATIGEEVAFEVVDEIKDVAAKVKREAQEGKDSVVDYLWR